MYNEKEQEKEHSNSESQKEFAQAQETQHVHVSTEDEDPRVDNIEKNADSNDGYEKSQKHKNERFIIFALIAGVVIVSVLVGTAMIFFYPTQNTVTTTAMTEPLTHEDSVSEDEANDDSDVVIIYGGSEEETETTETITDNANVESDSAEKPKRTETSSVSAPSRSTSESERVQKTKNIPESRSSIAEKKSKSKTKSAEISKARGVKSNTQGVKPTVSPITKKQIPSVNTKAQIYWVQVFSTGNRNKAYSIKNEFEKRGITLVVITKTINDKLYYRLRIGPYYKKSEGDKFLQWVKKIDVYKDAYLTMNYI